jgi:hypothetical protein
MSKANIKKEKTLRNLGLLFVFIGLVFNELVFARFFSPDGIIAVQNRIIILFLEATLIILGLCFIYPKKKIPSILLVIFISFIGSIILFEIFLRFHKEHKRVSIYFKNPNGTGSFRIRPNLHLVTNFGYNLISIDTNSLGMRWREVKIDNPLNKRRIAFVGDSFAFGFWSDKAESGLAGVFDSQLNGRNFEVINFAVPGYGLLDIELQIKEQVLLFKPEYLILMFFNGNDFRDTYLGLNKYDIVDGAAVLNKANFDKNVPKDFRPVPEVKNLARKRWLDYITKSQAYRLFEIKLAERRVNNGIDFSPEKCFSSHTFWCRKNYPDVAIKAKDLSLQILNNIRGLCNQNNIKLIIVSIPFKEQVYSNVALGDDYDIHFPQKYIEEFAQRYAIPYLDLLPGLRHLVSTDKKDIYYKTDEHFNNYGHRIVGELVSSFFENVEKIEQASFGKAGVNKS